MKKLFKQVSYEWLQNKKIQVKYSTYARYVDIINVHLNTYFGEKEMETITYTSITNFFIAKMQENKYSKSTMTTIRLTLKSILEYAEHQYGYNHIYMDSIKLPKTTKKRKVLTYEEKNIIEQYCFENKNTVSIAILLGLYGGLRLGEICSLQWKDINLKTGIINVNKTVQRLKNKDNTKTKTALYVSEPKSETSLREVPIPSFIIQFLKNIYININSENKAEYYVATSSSKIKDPRTLQIQFNKLCKNNNILINFHSLRHTYATNCIMSGVEIKSLSEILGHSNVSITMNLYVHSTMEFKQDQINKLKSPVFSQD